MLEVESNESERFERLSQNDVVDRMLAGTIKAGTRARRSDPDWSPRPKVERTAETQPLLVHQSVSELISAQESALLSDRLLQELHAAYQAADAHTSGGTPSFRGNGKSLGIYGLQKSLIRLTVWSWPALEIELRVLWLHAWVHELTGDHQRARDGYDDYLKRISELSTKAGIRADALQNQIELNTEANLTLLAINNRAVLGLQLSGLAKPDPLSLNNIIRIAIQQLVPGACLSVANILDLAWWHHVTTGETHVLALVRKLILKEYLYLESLYQGQAKPKAAPADKGSAQDNRQEPATTKGPKGNRNEVATALPKGSPAKELGDDGAEKDERYAAALIHWKALRNIHQLTEQAKKAGSAAAGNKGAAKASSAKSKAPPSLAPPTKQPTPEQRIEEEWRKFVRQAAELAHCAGSNLTAVSKELRLWPPTSNLLFKAPPPLSGAVDNLAAILARHATYAEAVSIVYPRDLAARAIRPENAPGKPTAGETKSRPQAADLESRFRELLNRGDVEGARILLEDGSSS